MSKVYDTPWEKVSNFQEEKIHRYLANRDWEAGESLLAESVRFNSEKWQFQNQGGGKKAGGGGAGAQAMNTECGVIGARHDRQ